MIKFTANWSRFQVEQGVPYQIGARDWLISISDVDTPRAVIADNFDRVLFLKFDDAERETDGTLMSEAQAKEIAAFIREADAKGFNVWANCHAGMCRSGAVVEVLGMLGWQIADDYSPERIPNRHVFNLLRKQFKRLLNSWEI